MASKRDGLIASAEKSLQKGKADAALKDYLKVLEETPSDINILNKVGDLYVRLNRNEESIPYFTKIAEHYSRDGFFLKAIAIYKKINKLDPARLDVYEKLAELYGKQGLGMEAKSQYQVLADYYTKQDNLVGAVGIYQKMLAGEPSNIQLHVKLADLYTQTKKVPDALKEYAIVAGMLRDRGAFEESIQVYEKALKIAPDNVEILKTFVPLLLDSNRLEEARGFLKKALETTPRSVPLFVLAADAALAANDMAEARSYASKAQAVDPENEEVLSCAVKIQLKSRRPDLAFAAAGPLADIAIRRGEAKKALGLLVPIAKAAPDNEDILKKIIEVSVKAGDEKAAVPYRSALAEVWRRQGKIVEAVDALKICTRLAPDTAEYRARLAQLEPLLPPPPAARPSEPLPQGDISFPGVAQKPKTSPGVQAPPPPRPAPAPVPIEAKPDEFEFDLADEELVEAPAPPREFRPPTAPPVPPPSFTPVTHPRSLSMEIEVPPSLRGPTPAEREAALDKTPPGLATPVPPPEATAADWSEGESGAPSAAEAMEAFEARQAEDAAAKAAAAPEIEEAEELVELPEAAELAGAEEALADRAPSSFEMLQGAIRPAAPAPPVTEAEVEEALVEAEVFRKYGLLEKAVEQLKNLLKRQPEAVRVREKLFEILLEQGKKAVAAKEAQLLVDAYRRDGREDRIRALSGLLGEPLAGAEVPEFPQPLEVVAPLPAAAHIPAVPEPAPHPPELPSQARPVPVPPKAPAPLPIPHLPKIPEIELPDFSIHAQSSAGSGKFRPVRADEIEIPLPISRPAKARAPHPTPPAEVELPPELLRMRAPKAPVPRPPAAPPPVAPPSPAAATREVPILKPTLPAPPPVSLEAGLPSGFLAPPEPPPAVVASPHLEEPAPVEIAPPFPPPSKAPAEEIARLDFCLDQGMVVDAAEQLQSLEERFPEDPDVSARRQRLEGTKGPGEEGRPPLQDIFSEDLESVLDAELGKALTTEMARQSGQFQAPKVEPKAAPAPAVDESGLFSDEQEFFNFAEELQTEMKQETAPAPSGPTGEVSLEEIFREFKKGVEQQLSPEDYETHYNLGIAYKEMALIDEAIGEFQLAAKDPLHAVECCSMLGLCFLEKGLAQLAIKWYRKGLETSNIRDEDRLGLLYDLAVVYQDVGDRENAYKTFLDIYGSNAAYRDVGDRIKELGADQPVQ